MRLANYKYTSNIYTCTNDNKRAHETVRIREQRPQGNDKTISNSISTLSH